MTTFEKLVDLIADQLGIDTSNLTMETNLTDDLDADSLDKVEMVVTAEEMFGIQIDDDAAIAFKTIGDVVNYIDNIK